MKWEEKCKVHLRLLFWRKLGALTGLCSTSPWHQPVVLGPGTTNAHSGDLEGIPELRLTSNSSIQTWQRRMSLSEILYRYLRPAHFFWCLLQFQSCFCNPLPSTISSASAQLQPSPPPNSLMQRWKCVWSLCTPWDHHQSPQRSWWNPQTTWWRKRNEQWRNGDACVKSWEKRVLS